jgi:DNA-binding CsgD family transcriptional regulator
MDYKEYTKRELADILYLIQSSLACRVSADVIRLLKGIKQLLGGDCSVCGIEKWDGREFPEPPAVINCNFPEEWLRIFIEGEFYNKCPIVLNTMKKPGPRIWVDTRKSYMAGELRRLSRVDRFGLRYGISGGMFDKRTCTGSFFAVTARRNTFDEHHLSMVEILTTYVHQALERVYRNARLETISLTKREKEVLKWVKDGKTNWEISMILKISERTVKFHIKNFLRKLNAVNKTHAAAIAAELGLDD